MSYVWVGVRLSSWGRRWLPHWAVAFIFVCLLVGALAPRQSLQASAHIYFFWQLFVCRALAREKYTLFET